MDPVEWAARLEDRYYNNHAFISPAVLNQPTSYYKNHCYIYIYNCSLCCCSLISIFLVVPSSRLLLKHLLRQRWPCESYHMCLKARRGRKDKDVQEKRIGSEEKVRDR